MFQALSSAAQEGKTISFTTRVPLQGVGGGGRLHERPRQQHQHIRATERIHHQGERSHARTRPPQTRSRWNDPC